MSRAGSGTFRLRVSPAVLAVATIPMWLSLMDVTILNVGYDHIVASLGATLDEVSWASTAYTLAGIVGLPLTGWLVARFGRKRVFLVILSLFTIGSALCALATNATQLAAFRLLQGLGGGLQSSVSQAIFLDAYPDEERGKALNLLSVSVMVGPFAGPILAGFILQHFAWPVLFLINVPLGVLTLWLAASLDVDQKDAKPAAAFSPWTIVLLFATLFAFQFAVQNGERMGWFDSAQIRWSLAACVVLAVVLVVQQTRLARPMIDFALFRNRDFSIGSVLLVVAGGSNYALAFFLPLFLQQVLGFTPLQAGLMTVPATIAMFAGNRLQDVACKRFTIYAVVAVGMAVLAVSLWFNGLYADMNTFQSIFWLRAFQGFAVGIFMIPIGVLSLRSIARRDIDAASGMSALIRQASGMIGIALIADLIERYQNVFYRTLLLVVPRWPTHVQRLAVPNLTDVLARRATVLAYQHVFSISAIVMLAAAVGIALFGIYEMLQRQNGTLVTAGADLSAPPA